MMKIKDKSNSAADFLDKAMRYCTYRERSAAEVEFKLSVLGCDPKTSTNVIDQLKEEGYVNDARFAEAFAGSKFRTRKWGKTKIRYELKAKGIDNDLIIRALGGIPAEEYQSVLDGLLKTKYKTFNKGSSIQIKQKLMSYAFSKGYETDVVYGALARIFKD